jgi:hypothetical protein
MHPRGVCSRLRRTGIRAPLLPRLCGIFSCHSPHLASSNLDKDLGDYSYYSRQCNLTALEERACVFTKILQTRSSRASVPLLEAFGVETIRSCSATCSFSWVSAGWLWPRLSWQVGSRSSDRHSRHHGRSKMYAMERAAVADLIGRNRSRSTQR